MLTIFLATWNDIKPVVITFFGTIGLLIVFMGACYLAKFISDKLHNKKVDTTMLKGKIYQLIYENKNLTKEDLIKYIDVNEDIVNKCLTELINDNVIVCVDNKYSVNKTKDSNPENLEENNNENLVNNDRQDEKTEEVENPKKSLEEQDENPVQKEIK